MECFSAYTEFFKDEYMMSILYRTIKVSLISSIICMLIECQYLITYQEHLKKLRGLFIALTVFPILTNSVVRSFAWMSILGKNGVINTLLMKLNLITEPLSLLYTEGAHNSWYCVYILTAYDYLTCWSNGKC